ncbi:uncharacterized protein EI90DRAFT_3029749 [Cantharellus anzutake]|uniref:uncharacterized protein n=1 Tax=Cantharellus anzutake TaxID=1750568 RepID=UPI0019087D2E|nr:uncharacterized protein EI90DRAFT_3029749 [Cantharellus anzutake]KAF8342648.1 hypothetical protein EI90DRAFT_3029749 [Cantharellus anzutake]
MVRKAHSPASFLWTPGTVGAKIQEATQRSLMDAHQNAEDLKNPNTPKFPAPVDDHHHDLAKRRLANSERIVNKLPEAVLSGILEHVRRAAGFLDETPLFSLMKICHHWRQVIWNEPVLWTCASIIFSKSGSAEKQLALHIDRSKGLPLSVKLSFTQRYPNLGHTWRPPETLFILFTKAMPALEELVIQAKPSTDYTDDCSSMLFLPSMVDRCLRRVDIRNSSTWSFSLKGLSRTILTELHIDQAMNIKSTWAFLKQCVALEHLYWRASSRDGWTPKSQLRLPRLKTLVLQGDIASYSQAFQTVNLQHLFITQSTTDEPPKISTSPPLRTAVINAPSLSLAVLDDFVLRHPCLESLALTPLGIKGYTDAKWVSDVSALPQSVLSRTLIHHSAFRSLYLVMDDGDVDSLHASTDKDASLTSAVKRIVTQHTGITGRVQDDVFELFWCDVKEIAAEFSEVVKIGSRHDLISVFGQVLEDNMSD